ncbi:integral membrane protein GPR180, putative [Plasmodium chabaudi chabaudi]|uniref:Integral membrane protein GPR180, putative n=1 Tax=Plasmodium chabaudi chabaudi TaxID=31271 RepID=A0A1D3S3M5_PLACU|nr:integral membrane protein GPR180, putative [Plasmodium chabaudi chabaudi]
MNSKKMEKKTIYYFFMLIVSYFIIHNVESKVFHGNFYIKKNEKIHYLTKFSCNIGTCEFNIKMKLKDNILEKMVQAYYKMKSSEFSNNINNEGVENNKLFYMDYDNSYYVLTNNHEKPFSQRVTLMLDIEEKYVNKNEKCHAFGNLRSVHRFSVPFQFKYSDLINSRTYNLKKITNNKYSKSFDSIYSELQNNKYLQSEILNYETIINEKNSNYEYKNIYAKTTHRVHVWFLMFDDCYDNFVRNLKLNIKTKIAYWEYLLYASERKDISHLSALQPNDKHRDNYNDDDDYDDDTKYYKTYNFDKNTLLENPKRLLFIESSFTQGEREDISFFLKYYDFKKMKNFTNMYNNLYKNGFYEQVIDYIYENEGFNIEYEVNILQANNSHFSYELLHSPLLTSIITLLYVYLIYQYGEKIFKNISSRQNKHIMVVCLAFVILIQLISNFLLFIHLLVYSQNGIGIELFKLTFNILNFLVQIIMCTMLLSLSYGLTIFEAKISNFTKIKVIFVVITFFHIILVVFDNTYIKDSSSKFFDNDNITGYIILALRILLSIVYHINLSKLYKVTNQEKISKFLQKLYICGLFYILSFPIIFMICYIFDTYWRQRFMLFGTAFLQYVSIYFITKMFLTNSEYFKVSDMSASDLPGATSSLFNQKAHAH